MERAPRGMLTLCLFALGAVGSAATLGGCGAGEGSAGGAEHPGPGPALPPPPSTWVFHPRTAAQLAATLALPEGRRLEVDRAGNRWLVGADGQVEASAYGAPEALVGVLPEGNGVAVLGESGAVYWSSRWLGPFEVTRRPPRPFVRAAAGGKRLLGVSEAGQLFASEDAGQGWTQLALPTHVTDVVLDAEGTALVLGTPERWFRRQAAAADFVALPWSSVGPLALGRTARGGIRVDGLLAHYLLEGDRLTRDDSPAPALPSRPQPPFVDAQTFVSGRAAWSGEEVVVFEEGKGSGAPQKLLRGAFSGPLTSQELGKTFAGCGRARLALGGSWLHVVCADPRSSGVSPRLLLWSSADGGHTFTPRSLALRGTIQNLVLAASERGDLAFAGVCPAETTDAGCQPRDVQLLRAGGSRLEPLPFVDTGRPAALAFFAQRLWALGRRVKDAHLTLQGVEGWAEAPRGATAAARLVVWFDLERETALPVDGSAGSVELAPGADALGVSVGLAGGLHVATLSAQGELLGNGWAPAGADVVSGAGAHWLAIDRRSSSAWESNDGGVAWRRVELPRALCSGPPAAPGRACSAPLVCREAGCLVGSELTRIGWGGGEGGTSPTLASPGSSPATAVELVARCVDVAPREELPQLHWLPGASEAALGDVAFAGVEIDQEHAALLALHAPLGQKKLVRRPLLEPVAEPERYALAVSPQVEGSAALRYRLPDGAAADGRLTDVEVAWDSRISGVLGKGRLAGAQRSEAGDFESRGARSARARPELLSVAGDGLYLRLHAQQASQASYFFQGDRVRVVAETRWPEGQQGEREFLQFRGHDVPLLWLRDGRVVLTAYGGEFLPYLLSPLQQRATVQSTGIAYRGQDVGLLSILADRAGTYWSARVSFVNERGVAGPDVAVPLLPDTRGRIRACSAEERAKTTRVVAPAQPSVPREVSLELRGAEPERLQTRRAVLHGTPEDPCIAAYEAELPESTSRLARLLWLPGEGNVSWLFRQERSSRAMTVQALSCAAPSAEAPDVRAPAPGANAAR
ncbi:MAG TPA: hypothetical protein VLC09_15180 [Polyangiaceae bacterium]|nr:hypothetical protein [Polyangiaceae bacterium]